MLWHLCAEFIANAFMFGKMHRHLSSTILPLAFVFSAVMYYKEETTKCKKHQNPDVDLAGNDLFRLSSLS